MFCYQCEQTSKGVACTKVGICGKEPETSNLQDLLLEVVKSVSFYSTRLKELKLSFSKGDKFIIDALFTTVTNVNFDSNDIAAMIYRASKINKEIRDKYRTFCKIKKLKIKEPSNKALVNFKPTENLETLNKIAEKCTIDKRVAQNGDEITGMQELIIYGLKGAAAYAHHAEVLGIKEKTVYDFFKKTLSALSEDHSFNELTELALKTGECNYKVMELLDKANTGAYGNPVPTKVRTTPVKGKAILVSGHDLKDLEELLIQTENTGINIYTHSEMLPAHGYPELKKYKHLAGNYGSAWQNQKREFDDFPGAILMTTNCIQKPTETYKKRIFTSGLVGWPGVDHIEKRNFKPVIEAAKKEKGFEKTEAEKTITVGFGHNTVMGVAGKVIELINKKKIKHFFLIGGCDGAKPGRNYYTEFAEKVPKDCVILTLACGKYRFNNLEFGEIEGIPRLLDVGQCNDAYSAIQIALALSSAFKTDVNSLPLSLVLSWYEQKAVAILLTLLHLGIKNIKIGPSLPAFVPAPLLKVLVENFGLKPISTASQDLKEILAR